MSNNPGRLFALLCAIAIGAALRLVPHPSNFSPIDGMALFSGAYLGRRSLAFVAPLCALLLSDLVLGFYSGMLFQYLAVCLVVLLGSVVLYKVTVPRLIAGALASSILFFVVSNLGVWLAGGIYPLTAAGLEACFIAALPFYQNSAAGDLFYSAILFGGFAAATYLLPQLRAGDTQPA